MNRIKDFFKESINIPNIISLIRIFLIVPCVISLLKDEYLIAAIYLILSGLSDILDGFFARYLNQVTKLGQILDPIADKLTLSAVIISMSIKVPALIPVAIVLFIKDFAMLIAGINLLNKNIMPPPAKWYGKISTIFFYFSVIIVWGMKAIWAIDIPFVTCTLFVITMAIMIFALVKYFMIYTDLINKYTEKDNVD